MHKIFKKSRSISPSFEIPKICLPRQKKNVDETDGCEEIKSTLSVPGENRQRSSSFDSSSLTQESLANDLLKVPKKHGRRCHSFDSASTLQISAGSPEDNKCESPTSPSSNKSLKVPKSPRRRSSLDIPRLCIHCIHLEAKAKETKEREEALLIYQSNADEVMDDYSDGFSFTSSTSYTSTSLDSLSDPSGFYYLDDSEDEGNESDCEDDDDYHQHAVAVPCSSKNDSLDLAPPCDIIKEDFLSGLNIRHMDSKDDSDEDIDDDIDDPDDADDEDYVNVVTLAVPVLKQRSSSMDACFLKSSDKGTLGERKIQRQKSFENDDLLDVPMQVRSSSVDVNLPTEEEKRYKAIPHSDTR